MAYIPHTEEDTQDMLQFIGVNSIQDLFDEIPEELRYSDFQGIPHRSDEMSMQKQASRLAQQNQNGICFMGAGSYEHHIPAAVWDIASRGEFLTAYTPYQAEASQGTLQLLFEFQTMIASLTGMDVANASMYDGATALSEAILMASRIKKEQQTHKILVPQSLHPHYQETLKTILSNQQIEIISIPFDLSTGVTDLKALQNYHGQDITAVVIPQPNFFGALEPVDALCDFTHAENALAIACVNPISLALLKPPSAWGQKGADIVCGEGQPLGAPLASGGPYFGFFSTRLEYVRQMPGRIVGQTVDQNSQVGYTLTLQAREQHIRRAKATSNICTNQGLLVTAATIHMSLLGPHGLLNVAKKSHQNTMALVHALCRIPGVQRKFNSPIFHEAVLQLPKPAKEVLQQLADEGILGGVFIEPYDSRLKNCILICATEMRTAEDIALYAKTLQKILG